MNPKLSDDVAEMLAALEAWHRFYKDQDWHPFEDYELKILKLLRRFGRIK